MHAYIHTYTHEQTNKQINIQINTKNTQLTPLWPPFQQPVPQNDYYARYELDKLPENGGLSPRFTRKFTGMSTSSGGGGGGGGGGGSDSTERQFMRVLQKVYQTIEKNEMRLADQDRRETIREEWQQLALIVDRLLLICFVILTATISLALILPGYSSQFEYGGSSS